MYKSPIEILTNQIILEQEGNVYKAVLEQGIVVDKDKLIKALQYDRDQYDKGYRDGMQFVLQEFSELLEKITEVQK